MKCTRFLAAAFVLFCFCSSASAQVLKTKTKVEGDEVKYKNKGYLTTYNEQSKIYKPTYSGQFVPGNQVYATLVLQAWKNYEINMLDEVRGMLADTLTAVMGDGTVLKGKENFLNAIKAYRNSYSLLKVNVAAWLPTKSIDLNKETVCIWGLEDGTKTDGTAMRVAVHEVWFFNKDGKVDFFRQYIQPNPQQ